MVDSAGVWMMNVYSNDNDSIVAESREDAIKVWNEFTNENWIEDDYGEIEDWKKLPDGDELAIQSWEEMEPKDYPPRAVYEAMGNVYVATATAEDWAIYSGRGWLCSLDF